MSYSNKFAATRRTCRTFSALGRSAQFLAAVTLSTLPAAALAQERKTLDSYDAGTTVATVGGQNLTMGDLIVSRPRLPKNVEVTDPNILFDELLRTLINAEIIAQAAEKAGIGDDPAIKLRLEAHRRTTLGQYYLAKLAASKITEASLKGLYDEMMQNEITRAPFVQTSFRVIQLEEEKAAKDALAAAKGGADFADLAKKLSTHVSNQNGGLIDYHSPGARVSPIEQAAMALKEPGDLSDVIAANGKFYVVRLEGKRPLEFEQVIPALRQISYNRIASDELERLQKEIAVKAPDALPPGEAIMRNDLLK